MPYVLIAGFTKRTSFSLSKYLLKQGYTLIITDSVSDAEKKSLIKELGEPTKILDFLGNQTPDILKQFPIEIVFVSPGVPRSIPLLRAALAKNIPVLNDIEYFYRQFPKRQYIAVTGTDGKTTVAMWLYYTVSQQKKCVLAGNVGTPIFDFFDEKYDDYVFILELSSFQLESLSEFHAHAAVVINISEDHLDRYESLQDYALAKKNIFLNMTHADLALINDDDIFADLFQRDCSAQMIFFSKNHTQCPLNLEALNDFLGKKPLKVPGVHQRQNALIVLAFARFLGVSDVIIKQALISFPGVDHRLQFVASIDGISYYNDSKATSPQAVQIALTAFEQPVVLIAGGRSKNADFSALVGLVEEKTKYVALFGEMAQTLYEIWGIQNKSSIWGTLEEAFVAARNHAQIGDCIILSPGGSSFDLYQSYEERGNHFINLVHNQR
ncbi:UDP-N-acetylmuramoylalanine--D-glutamate ligase [Brevinema andersonii]|uniref:UDP-N-acetylmuramoylalanine--D-glutamate ligase n=1 Tax=Brevinema andersonii TaxID=34097 RepID=A0A1I1CZE0_BREAD|nr:UDP-N-acetylmuramoyl-L-alanine--D-glutamate ligase [Brevinema andersonii]SFB67887.1 UDP-N-acetylmuramoylalanine--D-glutamate ligase [Brevinema andersonii]